MWWEYGKERLLERVKGLEELAMHEDANLIRAVIGVLEKERDEFMNKERSLEEAASYTDVSSGQLRRDITDGKLPVRRVKGRGPARVRLADVQEYRGTQPAPRLKIVPRGFNAAALANQLTQKRSEEGAA
jgi:excisionase family DNA binding protein